MNVINGRHFVHRWKSVEDVDDERQKSEGKLFPSMRRRKITRRSTEKVTGRILTCSFRLMVHNFLSNKPPRHPQRHTPKRRKKCKQRKFHIKKFYSHSGWRRKKGKQTTQGCELNTREKMNLQ